MGTQRRARSPGAKQPAWDPLPLRERQAQAHAV